MLFQFIKVASGQVGPSDASLKQHIARKHTVVSPAVIDKASGRVSRYMDCFQCCVSEGDDVSVMEIFSQWDGCFIQLETEHATLFGGFVYPVLVGLIGFGRQPELAKHEWISENVIQMQVSVQQMFYVQIVGDDEVL